MVETLREAWLNKILGESDRVLQMFTVMETNETAAFRRRHNP
jgi:hypothetical protein